MDSTPSLRSTLAEAATLSQFLDYLELRMDSADGSAPRTLSDAPSFTEDAARGGIGVSFAVEDRQPKRDVFTTNVSEHVVVARLRRAMNDDGRRRYAHQAPGFDGALAQEYQNLFASLVDACTDKGVTSVQSYWRTKQKRQRLVKWKANRQRRLRVHLRAWMAVTNADSFFSRALCRWVWRGWQQVVSDAKRIQVITWKVFRGRVGQPSLSITAVNLFFSGEAVPPDALMANALHLGVRRQILASLIRAWCAEVKRCQRCRTQAIVTMQRALRRNPDAKIHWTPELLGLCFHMWRRSYAYKRAFKAMTRLPKFTDPDLPEWSAWTRQYMSHQLLKQKADKRGLRIFKLNKLRRWRWYTRYMKGIADRLVQAAQYYEDTLRGKVLRTWLAYTRCRGHVFRRRVVYFKAWKAWAPRKKRLRQLKQLLLMKATKNIAQHGLHKWSRCLNNVRLLNAYRLRRIWDPSAFFPVMSVSYTLNSMPANSYLLHTFQRWQVLRARRVAWRSFYYLHQRSSVQQLLGTIFRAWRHSTGKWTATGETLSLEPPRALDRNCALAAAVRSGYRPEGNLPGAIVEKLIPRCTEGSEVQSDLKPRTVCGPLEQQLLDAIAHCDKQSINGALGAGARVDFCDERDGDRTPLHLACSFFSERFVPVVALLLHCGADPERRDSRGLRPVDVATNPQVAALLHSHVARVAAVPTQAELSGCVQHMSRQWSDVGGVSLWRFVVHELAALRARGIEEDLAKQAADGVKRHNVGVAKKRIHRLASVGTFMVESQRDPVPWEAQRQGTTSDTPSPLPPAAIRRTSLHGVVTKEDDEVDDPVAARRRQV